MQFEEGSLCMLPWSRRGRPDLYEVALLQAGSDGGCLSLGIIQAVQQLLVIQQAALHQCLHTELP